jgi:GT2 family glycosyltransferase
MTASRRAKVLHVITVYNGRAFVPRAIRSARDMASDIADIDVLILDDASPEPGFSAMIEAYCKEVGANYYLAPRNLGIPRNVSLGLQLAVTQGYDYVTVNNSDVIFPRNLITSMIETLSANQGFGSLTAWSNNVSIYTLPNRDPDHHLAQQPVVDGISSHLQQTFGTQTIDIPAGISFCIMMPTAVVADVGMMDPIFGRGYCEETDWSLRSLAAGYRLGLGLGTFVYHMGRGSNLAAGLVSAHHTTVPENEAVIDTRYPEFRTQVHRFEMTGTMQTLKDQAIDALLKQAAHEHGLVVEPSWLQSPPAGRPSDAVRAVIMPNIADPFIRLEHRGFERLIPLSGTDVLGQIASVLGPVSPLFNGFDPLGATPAAPVTAGGAPYPRQLVSG